MDSIWFLISSKLANPRDILSTTVLRKLGYTSGALQGLLVYSVLEIGRVLVDHQGNLLEVGLELFFLLPQRGKHGVDMVLVRDELLVIRQVVHVDFVLDHLYISGQIHKSLTQQTVAEDVEVRN